jgi:hypothetical protein
MTINNRGLAGQPIRPYQDFRSYAGADVFVTFTFLDQTGTPVTPSSINYQLDDITNDVNMLPATIVTPTANPFILQIPGASLNMTYPYQGSQLCQLAVQATLLNTVTGTPSSVVGVAIIELCAIQTPSGSF